MQKVAKKSTIHDKSNTGGIYPLSILSVEYMTQYNGVPIFYELIVKIECTTDNLSVINYQLNFSFEKHKTYRHTTQKDKVAKVVNQNKYTKYAVKWPVVYLTLKSKAK